MYTCTADGMRKDPSLPSHRGWLVRLCIISHKWALASLTFVKFTHDHPWISQWNAQSSTDLTSS
jgi:hypothetical protein